MVIYPFAAQPASMAKSPFGAEPEVSKSTGSDRSIMEELLRRTGKMPTGGSDQRAPVEDKTGTKIVNALSLQSAQTVAALNLDKQRNGIMSEMLGVLKGIRNVMIGGFETVRIGMIDASYDAENEGDKESGIGDAAGGAGTISMWLSKPLTQISKLMMMPFNWLGGAITTAFTGIGSTLAGLFGLKKVTTVATAGAEIAAKTAATGIVESGAGVAGKTAQIAKAGKAGEGLGSSMKIFGKAFGKLGGLLKFVGKLAWPIAAIMSVFDFISGFGKAGQVFEGEIGLKEKLASAFGAVISGLTFGILDFEKTAKAVNKVFSWFGDLFKGSGLSENFGVLFKGVGDAFKDIFKVIGTLWEGVKPFVMWVLSVDMAILSVVGDVLMRSIKFVIGGISLFARDLGNILGIVGDLFGILGGLLTGDMDQIMENIYSIGDRFMDWISSWADHFKLITDLFGGGKEETKAPAPEEQKGTPAPKPAPKAAPMGAGGYKVGETYAGGQIRSTVVGRQAGGGVLSAERRAPRRARPSVVAATEYTPTSFAFGKVERPEITVGREVSPTADVLATTTAGKEQTREFIKATERQQGAKEKRGGGASSKTTTTPVDKIAWVIDDIGILAVNGDMF